jgi:hypothetical protein
MTPDGEILVVGAPNDGKGVVFVFKRQALTEYQLHQAIEETAETFNHQGLGSSVAINADGSIIVATFPVVSPLLDNFGTVRFFIRQTNGVYTRYLQIGRSRATFLGPLLFEGRTRLWLSDLVEDEVDMFRERFVGLRVEYSRVASIHSPFSDNNFGATLAISGAILAVGSDVGVVLYSTTTFAEIARLYSAIPGRTLGPVVALYGDIVIASSYQGSFSGGGMLEVYEPSSFGYMLSSTIEPPASLHYDMIPAFGRAIAVVDKLLFVGTAYLDPGTFGSVYIYLWSASGIYDLVHAVENVAGSFGSTGVMARLPNNAYSLAVGSPFAMVDGIIMAGSVEAYTIVLERRLQAC